ncbi:MAG: hypothetical protein JO079_02850 [Frankiaceae bacterium]|nr:hypothetical protein [Frankiaceae bacterium]
MGVLLFVLIAAAVLGTLAYFNYKREQARRNALFQWATANKWQFAVTDNAWAMRWNGSPFGEGDTRRARNVIRGTWKSSPFVSFDYSYETHTSDGRGGSSTQVHRYTVASLALPADLPRLQVTPESVFSRLGHALGMADIDLASEDFNRAFRVNCPDPKFASDALPPRTMELLLSRTHFCWRIEVTDLICWWSGEQTAVAVTEALSTMSDVVAGIPSFVWHDHGYDAGSAPIGGTP